MDIQPIHQGIENSLLDAELNIVYTYFRISLIHSLSGLKTCSWRLYSLYYFPTFPRGPCVSNSKVAAQGIIHK